MTDDVELLIKLLPQNQKDQLLFEYGSKMSTFGRISLTEFHQTLFGLSAIVSLITGNPKLKRLSKLRFKLHESLI